MSKLLEKGYWTTLIAVMSDKGADLVVRENIAICIKDLIVNERNATRFDDDTIKTCV